MIMVRLRPVASYYWPDIPNFGDRLSPFLLKHFSNIDPVWSPPGKAEVISIGSLLEHIPPYYDGYILGTGKLYPDSKLQLYTNTAKILALRGPLSASGISGDYALGDP